MQYLIRCWRGGATKQTLEAVIIKAIADPATIIVEKYVGFFGSNDLKVPPVYISRTYNWPKKEKYRFTVKLTNSKEISLIKYVKRFVRNRIFRSPSKRIKIPNLLFENRLGYKVGSKEEAKSALKRYFRIRRKRRQWELKDMPTTGVFEEPIREWKGPRYYIKKHITYPKYDEVESEIMKRLKKYWGEPRQKRKLKRKFK